MKKITLTLKNIHASIDGKPVLNGINVEFKTGKVYTIMGPNGGGKSTLSYVLMGHPHYDVSHKGAKRTSGLWLGAKNILKATTEERAKLGIFLAFQSPIAIPGVSVINLLRTAYQSRFGGDALSFTDFMVMVREYAKTLRIDETFLKRGIHDGFSGGEKKKIEMLQALVLKPTFAVFDEIDTGLDVDALKVVAHGIGLLAKAGTGVIVITHYQRILEHLEPDVVHILVKGKIVKTGTYELAKRVEKKGYSEYAVSN
jgi:Fe-S cluster assembly ATP-binding protein